MRPFQVAVVIAAATLFLLKPVWADMSQSEDFTDLSLEELMEVRVSSVSRKEEPLLEAPAAAFVLSQKDIRRSGATTIPELLRMVPGVQVAQISANTWAISARGFNNRFSDKLLVLIDGRTVYSPFFSGTFWDEQDTVIEDIERIEVLRGPGGTLWGANAVNGVINIITKHTEDTQGGLASSGGGTVENGFATVRYGGALGETAGFRVYGKYYDRDEFEKRDPLNPPEDGWNSGRGGFRIDWDASENNAFTFQGDYYNGTSDQRVQGVVSSLTAPFTQSRDQEVDIEGGNFLLRWNRKISETSDFKLQTYYNNQQRSGDSEDFSLKIDTFDVDFQHRFALGSRNEIVWGAGSRLIWDTENTTFQLSIDPDDDFNYRYDGFIQDKLSLIPDQLALTVGSKFEINSFTGFEFQPNARLSWTPDDKHILWASVSRAVRTPSRSQDALRSNLEVRSQGNNLTLVSLMSNAGFDSEDLLAIEAGFRWKPLPKVFFDISAFYNFYEDLLTLEQGSIFLESSPAPLHAVVPITFDNKGSGETYGLEMVARWKPFSWWDLESTFTWLEMNLDSDRSSTDDTLTKVTEDRNPNFQGTLRSMIDLPHNLEFDTNLYFVDKLDKMDVPAYTRVDLRLGWKPVKNLEWSLALLNLQDSQHAEFNSQRLSNLTLSEVPRSVYSKLTWRFE